MKSMKVLSVGKMLGSIRKKTGSSPSSPYPGLPTGSRD
jgi:hypothetical protein